MKLTCTPAQIAEIIRATGGRPSGVIYVVAAGNVTKAVVVTGIGQVIEIAVQGNLSVAQVEAATDIAIQVVDIT